VFGRLVKLAICASMTVTVTAALASNAAAAVTVLTPGASAYAAAAGTGSASLQANLQLKGSLGKILDSLIGPIVSQDLNPLVAALQGTVTDAVDAALGASSNLNAATDPSQPQASAAPAAFPTDTLPSPCLATGAQPCYQAATSSLNGAPLASASLGVLSGYAEQVVQSADSTNPIFARASTANAKVSVLPGLTSLVPGLPSATNPLVAVNLASAKANCPNDGAAGATKPVTSPSAVQTTTGVSLLGGLVTFDSANGWPTNLVVNGVSYADTTNAGNTRPGLLSLSAVTVAGITVARYGQSVIISIPLTPDQIFTALGLPSAVVTALDTFIPTSSVTLSLVVGSSSTVTATTATAWGLGIGVDLSGSLSFNLLDLVTANVNIPSGVGSGNYGNVLDMRLGYASCQSGIKPGSSAVPAIPPALV
jgi:hypothetical protein